MLRSGKRTPGAWDKLTKTDRTYVRKGVAKFLGFINELLLVCFNFVCCHTTCQGHKQIATETAISVCKSHFFPTVYTRFVPSISAGHNS